MSQPTIPQLRDFLLAHFNTEELKDLCLNLFVEYEDLGGEGRSGKARELALLMQRHGQLDHFCAILSQERPEAYRRVFQQAPPAALTPPASARPKRDPRRVFISHAHQDAEFAQRLAGDLRARGFSVWIAPDSIRIGEQWPEAIDRGLEESGVVVVALTPDALTSAWVRKETFAAIHLESLGRITFVPLDVAECEPPILWRTYQFAPFRRDYATGLRDLLARLSGAPVDRRIHEKTGIELIRIPAGPFLYGSSDSDKMARDNEKPQRTIDLSEYWIGRTPVTKAQFARFAKAKNYRTTAEQQGFGWAWTGNEWDQVKGADWRHPNGPKSGIGGKDDHPVVQVSWHDAQAFCDWAGLVLPSEEQWEKAARGTDSRLWPWGYELPTVEHCNFNKHISGTTPVGKYSPRGDSPYGCVDMAGNVSEWTATFYEEESWALLFPPRLFSCMRGGSWETEYYHQRCAERDEFYPHLFRSDIGFRALVPRP